MENNRDQEAKQFTPEQDAIRIALHTKLMEVAGHLDPISVAYVVSIFAGEALGAMLLSCGISKDDIVEGSSQNIRFGVEQVMQSLGEMRQSSH